MVMLSALTGELAGDRERPVLAVQRCSAGTSPAHPRRACVRTRGGPPEWHVCQFNEGSVARFQFRQSHKHRLRHISGIARQHLPSAIVFIMGYIEDWRAPIHDRPHGEACEVRRVFEGPRIVRVGHGFRLGMLVIGAIES